MHIQKNDSVVVIAGDNRGERGRVLSVDRQTGKVLIEGINQVLKHVSRSQRNPQGGRLKKEMPVQLSNVLLWCETCGKGIRTGARYQDDGSKIRYCKKCGTSMGQIAPVKKRYAKS